MKTSGTASSDLLGSIARRAMLERGLLPEFSPAALKQADAITAPAAAMGPNIRDLRALLWASIDNDDSRDLDQLSVAQRVFRCKRWYCARDVHR
jgi:exoribonuclease-2